MAYSGEVTNTQQDMVAAALAYAAAGWPVFPISPHTKKPYRGTHGFKDATTDPEKVKALWKGREDANIALATGRIVVCDADGDEGIRAFQGLGVGPATRVAKTPRGGLHFYYRAPEGVAIRSWNAPRTKGGPGLDVKGAGGYVLLPPSKTSVGAYTWLRGGPVAELSGAQLDYALRGGSRPHVSHETKVPPHLTTLTAQGGDLAGAAAERLEWTAYNEAEIASALKAITDDSYDNWIRIGAALHQLDWGEIGFRLWDQWSRQFPSHYTEGLTERKWASFGTDYRGARVTIGTVFGQAEDAGWDRGASGRQGPGGTAANGAYALPEWLSLAALRAKEFKPIHFAVQGYIAEGLTILAGRPKVGKSFLMLDCAIAVATGTKALNAIECEQGAVLYLALEDNERRLQSRTTRLLGYNNDWPLTLDYNTEWPRAAEGIARIERWITTAKNPRLVVVDVLERFRAPKKSKDPSPYSTDYTDVQQLQALAARTGIAIVVVHHLRKGAGDGDPIEWISGTLGLSAAADTLLVLNRGNQGTTLYGRGRDIEEIETAVSFDKTTCTWTIMGNAAEIAYGERRQAIFAALREANAAMTSHEIAEETEIHRNTVKTLLRRMLKKGEVEKAGRGRYQLPKEGKTEASLAGEMPF